MELEAAEAQTIENSSIVESIVRLSPVQLANSVNIPHTEKRKTVSESTDFFKTKNTKHAYVRCMVIILRIFRESKHNCMDWDFNKRLVGHHSVKIKISALRLNVVLISLNQIFVNPSA